MMEKWEKNIKKYPWHLLIALFALLGQGMWLCGSCEAVPLDGKWKYYESGHIEPNMVTLTILHVTNTADQFFKFAFIFYLLHVR